MVDVISADSLTKVYTDFSLDNVNLKVPSGSIFGLIGENGAGKTTLISLILNQISRDNGTVKIFGLDNILNEKEIKKNIGFVVDECCFHECFTAIDINNIMKLIYQNWDSNIFDSYLNEFGIQQDKKISEYSKGMKSKMMLAIAFSHAPKLLILDEVTSGLDPVVRDDILEMLDKFVSDGEKSVFFSTHITSDLDKIATHVAFLHKGKLIFSEKKEDLVNKYLMIEIDDNDVVEIKNSEIISQIKSGGRNKFLVENSQTIINKYNKIAKKVTIDDLMLMYVKGDGKK